MKIALTLKYLVVILFHALDGPLPARSCYLYTARNKLLCRAGTHYGGGNRGEFKHALKESDKSKIMSLVQADFHLV